MTTVRESGHFADALGQPPFSGVLPGGLSPPPAVSRGRTGGATGEITALPPARARVIDMPPTVIVEPQPADYAGAARKILHGRNRNVGMVLSVVRMLPADGQPMISTETTGDPHHPRLARPPAHVVQPAEVFEVQWRRMTLRYVWILASPKTVYTVGGILFLPVGDGVMFHLVTFNVGALDSRICTNVHHAETQAMVWIDEQRPDWRARLGGIGIWNLSRRPGLGYSPCNACCSDLAHFLVGLRALPPAAQAAAIRASITWLTIYDRNAACGHPTNTANLRRLVANGWQLSGPGWHS
jgi:hypothetical protein